MCGCAIVWLCSCGCGVGCEWLCSYVWLCFFLFSLTLIQQISSHRDNYYILPSLTDTLSEFKQQKQQHMKKGFFLGICLMALTAVFAQS